MDEIPYLERPCIEDAHIQIEQNYVKISSPTTIYVDDFRHKKLFKETLMRTYVELYKLAKKNCITVSYSNHYKRFVNEKFQEYEMELADASLCFDQLIDLSLQVQQRGIHYGTVNDNVLNETIKTSWEYSRHFYTNTVLARMESIAYKMQDLLDKLSSAEEYLKIHL